MIDEELPTPPPPPPEASTLRSSIVRGIGWMFASQGTTQILAFVTSIAIARLMSPRDVGIATEAIVFATFTLIITDFGLGAVIVQRPTLSELDISTAFWANMAISTALTAIGIGASWPIAALYGNHEIQPLFAVLSFVFVLTGPGIVPQMLLTREMEFGKLQRFVIIAATLSAATGIGLAAAGFGPWAIIAQVLVLPGLMSALSYGSSSWRPIRAFSWERLRGMLGFAGHTFGANALSWAQQNVDNFLVGRFIGAAPLGAYSIAASTSLTPLNRIAAPITQVFFPAFSRLRDPERIAEAWLGALRMVALIVVPLTFGLVVIGQEFVIALFGHKWHAAVTPLEVLAPIGLLQGFGALSTGVLSAIDRTQLLWRATAALSLASVASFAIGLSWGLDGVAIAYLTASVVLQPLFLHITARAVGRTLWDICRAVSGLLQAGLGMVVVTFVVRRLLLSAGVPIFPRLVLLVIAGGLTYVPLVAWRAPEIREQVLGVIRPRRQPGPEELAELRQAFGEPSPAPAGEPDDAAEALRQAFAEPTRAPAGEPDDGVELGRRAVTPHASNAARGG